MSVLIKGMEMPINCNCCVFSRLSPTGESLKCCIDYSTVPWDEKPFDCPLIPVPPHGDLIDRDALIKDGWLNLHKQVMRMGGYAIHELPLINPLIPVIIPADKDGAEC